MAVNVYKEISDLMDDLSGWKIESDRITYNNKFTLYGSEGWRRFRVISPVHLRFPTLWRIYLWRKYKKMQHQRLVLAIAESLIDPR